MTKRVKSSFDDILKFVKTKKTDISKNILSKSLYNIIEREIKVLDRLGREGTIFRGKFYIFQPYRLSNSITMVERRLDVRPRTKKIGLDRLLKKRVTKKRLENNIRVKMSSTLFLELLEKLKIHITKLGKEDNLENLRLIIQEVYDRIEYDNKIILLKNILEEMMKFGDDLVVEFDNEKGEFNFEGIKDNIMENFTLEDRNFDLMSNFIDYILKNKFFKVEGTLGFKIVTNEKMNYMKLNNKKLIELTDEEHK